MLDWFFRKRGNAGAPVAPAVNAAPAAAGAAGHPQPAAPNWDAQWQAAQGDDPALLRLAASAPALDLKMAAVAALSTEAALRQAEREFRSHDRRVHRLAKQRLEAAVAQRVARAGALALLARVKALTAEAEVPMNFIVQIDRDWEALPADLLEPDQCTRFELLRSRLDAVIREQGEAQQRLHRWLAEARRLLPEWRRALATAAEQGGTGETTMLTQTMQSFQASRPESPATAELAMALAQLLRDAGGVERRLAWFDAQPVAGAGAATVAAATLPPVQVEAQVEVQIEVQVEAQPEPQDETPADEPVACDAPPGLEQATAQAIETAPAPGWADLPPLQDAALAQALDRRHGLWVRAGAPAPPVAAAAPAAPAAGLPTTGQRDDAPARLRLRVEPLVQQAEQALGQGQLGALQQHLQAIDALLGAARAAALPGGLRARYQALRSEGERLKGWQQWGGARAREDLVAEAEALARQTQAATAAGPGDSAKLKLTLHAQAIQALRQRWKEVDRVGAAAGKPLWQRFDAALQTAHEPVAAQQAALKAARQENLAAREALLAGLDALPLPMDPAAPAAPANPADLAKTPDRSDPAGAAASAPAAESPLEWKDVVRELHAVQQAWRKLGPVEHTVPSGARQRLQQRWHDSIDRIEAPLQAVRRAAAETREQLIGHAEALAPQAGQYLPWPEAVRRVRDLQSAWQQQARQLPLPRALETDLWSRFKAATDAVFAQRDAAASAREAEWSANVAARESLLERLSSLGAADEPAGIERTLAEIDRVWRSPAELPRGAGEALEARYRAARAAALQLASTAQTRHWQARCDALAARLALCEEREAVAGTTPDLGQRWTASDGLPTAWRQALDGRWERAPDPGPLDGTAVDDLLLQLEAALDMPSPPERQAERRQLKLRALKEAMEGRGPAAPGPAQHAAAWLAMLRQGGLDAAQRQRLQALVAALRQSPPGALTQTGATARSAGA